MWSALGCARGAAPEALDASRFGATATDGGSDAGAPAIIDAGVPLKDAALVDQGPTNGKDAAIKDAGANETLACTATNQCVMPTLAGRVSGDTGSEILEATGSAGMFVLVNVSEDDHTPLIPKRMRVGASLNSPGADFDLFLHADGCASVIDQSELGFTENVDLTWNDSQGQDNGRKLILEVRHKSGACDPERPWVLTIRGN